MKIVLIVIAVLVVLLAISVIVSYNRFVRQRNLVHESWRQVDVELQRRHDLIPNLIETVRGFAAQERGVLESVVQARGQAMAARAAGGVGPAQMAQAETALSRSLGGLFAVAENYPTLGSNQNFLELQRALADTEDRIAAGRRFYNGNVRVLNTRVEAFPSSITASVFHFTRAEYFETEDPAVRANVRVDFSGVGADPSAVRPTAAAQQTLPGRPPTAPPQGGQLPPGGYQGAPGQAPGQQAPAPQGPPPGWDGGTAGRQYPGGPPR